MKMKKKKKRRMRIRDKKEREAIRITEKGDEFEDSIGYWIQDRFRPPTAVNAILST